MELFIALAIIIAINELKEYRLNKKFVALCDSMKLAETSLAITHKRMYEIEAKIEAIAKPIDAIRADIHSINLSHGAIQEKLEEVLLKSEAVLKEFELHGAPIKINREKFDIIEGV